MVEYRKTAVEKCDFSELAQIASGVVRIFVRPSAFQSDAVAGQSVAFGAWREVHGDTWRFNSVRYYLWETIVWRFSELQRCLWRGNGLRLCLVRPSKKQLSIAGWLPLFPSWLWRWWDSGVVHQVAKTPLVLLSVCWKHCQFWQPWSCCWHWWDEWTGVCGSLSSAQWLWVCSSPDQGSMEFNGESLLDPQQLQTSWLQIKAVLGGFHDFRQGCPAR